MKTYVVGKDIQFFPHNPIKTYKSRLTYDSIANTIKQIKAYTRAINCTQKNKRNGRG